MTRKKKSSRAGRSASCSTLIDEAYENSAWHGPTSRASLRGVTARRADVAPGAGQATASGARRARRLLEAPCRAPAPDGDTVRVLPARGLELAQRSRRRARRLAGGAGNPRPRAPRAARRRRGAFPGAPAEPAARAGANGSALREIAGSRSTTFTIRAQIQLLEGCLREEIARGLVSEWERIADGPTLSDRPVRLGQDRADLDGAEASASRSPRSARQAARSGVARPDAGAADTPLPAGRLDRAAGRAPRPRQPCANAYVRFKWLLTEPDPAIKIYDEAEWAKPEDEATPVGVSPGSSRRAPPPLGRARCARPEKEFARTLRHSRKRAHDPRPSPSRCTRHGRHHVAHITSLRSRMGWDA